MSAVHEQQEFYGLVLWSPQRPFNLRVNDVIRIEDRLGLVIRVTECSAVVSVNRPHRKFTTRFDKPVNFQPPPKLIRISANSATEILNRKRAPQVNANAKGEQNKTRNRKESNGRALFHVRRAVGCISPVARRNFRGSAS